MIIDERKELPLWVKLENAVMMFIENCTNKGFNEKFEHP